MASYAKSMSTCCLKNSKSIVSCIKGLSQGFFATFFGFSNYFYCIPCLFASVCCNDGIAVGVHGNHALFCLGIPVFSPPCKNRLGAASFVFASFCHMVAVQGLICFCPFCAQLCGVQLVQMLPQRMVKLCHPAFSLSYSIP